ncbi:unnamed protein product [Allacma fusca]|uniref:Uncharacterized protein n=1 Tax=Allacma fusca TaxID=39272 RepID=A0A8J2KIW0_9HEXA|nr:unnamed protein product [Allacma fusca]
MVLQQKSYKIVGYSANEVNLFPQTNMAPIEGAILEGSHAKEKSKAILTLNKYFLKASAAYQGVDDKKSDQGSKALHYLDKESRDAIVIYFGIKNCSVAICINGKVEVIPPGGEAAILYYAIFYYEWDVFCNKAVQSDPLTPIHTYEICEVTFETVEGLTRFLKLREFI